MSPTDARYGTFRSGEGSVKGVVNVQGHWFRRSDTLAPEELIGLDENFFPQTGASRSATIYFMNAVGEREPLQGREAFLSIGQEFYVVFSTPDRNTLWARYRLQPSLSRSTQPGMGGEALPIAARQDISQSPLPRNTKTGGWGVK